MGLREMARKHSISRSLIRQWIQKYETRQLTDELDEVRPSGESLAARLGKIGMS